MNDASQPSQQPAIRGVLAIVRQARIDDPEGIVAALVAGGVCTIEFTLTSSDALAAIAAVRARFGDGVRVGAGTVLTVEDVDAVVAAGGTFCVSPDTNPTVIERCYQHDVEPLPGAFTATEVATARSSGARAVKLFPAGVIGPSLVKALRGPFPDLDYVPTGSIALDDIAGYRRAGAVAVGLGSNLVPEDVDLEVLTRSASHAVAAWDAGGG